MSVGRILVEGAAGMAALLCGICAVDRASQRAAAALGDAQQRRREYARSVQRHYATCFAKGERVLATTGLCDVAEHINACLPIHSPDELRRLMTGATQDEKVKLWERTVGTVLARALVLPAALALTEISARVQLAVVAGQSLFAATASVTSHSSACSGTGAPDAALAQDPQQALARTALVESILRVYTEAYARLRAREPVLHRSLRALAAHARSAAGRFLAAHPIMCTLSYADAAAALAQAYRAMDDSVLPRSAQLMCPSSGTASSPPEGLEGDLVSDAALAEFLEDDDGANIGCDDAETAMTVTTTMAGAGTETETGVGDTVCDLLEMFARAAPQDACFEAVYRGYSEGVWRALLGDMRALFAAAPEEPPAALPVPKFAMRLAPFLDAFAAQETTLDAVAARGHASVPFEQYLFAVFLQQQPT